MRERRLPTRTLQFLPSCHITIPRNLDWQHRIARGSFAKVQLPAWHTTNDMVDVFGAVEVHPAYYRDRDFGHSLDSDELLEYLGRSDARPVQPITFLQFLQEQADSAPQTVYVNLVKIGRDQFKRVCVLYGSIGPWGRFLGTAPWVGQWSDEFIFPVLR